MIENQLICGVVGDIESASARGFLGSVPSGDVKYLDDSLVVSFRQTVAETASGLFWEPGLDGGEDSGWVDIAENRFAAGLVRSPGGWVLFNDSLGAHPIYYRVADGTTYFANRLDPFGNLPWKMHVDWDAWADIFQLGAPLGESTQFAEVRRIGAASGLLFDRSGSPIAVGFEPSWLSVSGQMPAASDVVDAVREALPTLGIWQRPPEVTLSGGWDSRLLAALAIDRYARRPRAWTSDQDDGTEDDIVYSVEVARALGLSQSVVQQDGSPWPELAAEARSRMDYQTWLHPWLVGLGRRMRSKTAAVLDGLAGDVLIKGLYVESEILDADPDDREELLFERLGGDSEARTGRFSDAFSSFMTGATRSRFSAINSGFEGHPGQLALTVLHTRTARAIALSPLRLFGPEMHVWMPFLSPSVLELTLSIPPGDKTGGRLYRQVLRHGAPEVADLPSTNDGRTPIPVSRPRRQASPEAVAWIVDSLLQSEPARSLLSPSLRSSIEQDGREWSPPDFWTSRFLQVVSLFAQWEIAHRDTLAEVALPA